MGGDGGKSGGGGGGIPYQGEMGQMLYGSLANRLAKSDPKWGATFQPEVKDSQGNVIRKAGSQAAQYAGIFGDQAPQSYTGFGTVPQVGAITQGAMQGIYGKPQGMSGGTAPKTPSGQGGK